MLETTWDQRAALRIQADRSLATNKAPVPIDPEILSALLDGVDSVDDLLDEKEMLEVDRDYWREQSTKAEADGNEE